MARKIEQTIMEWANYVARKFPGLKQILIPIYYPFLNLSKRKREKTFRKYSLKVLKDFHNCMEIEGYHYTLAFGSMLGAIREKGFIKHDIDIDVCLWIDEYNDSLRKALGRAGFKLDHYFLVDDGKLGREETYIKNGVSIDIFYIYPAINDLPYCCDFICYNDAPTFKSCNKKHGGAQPRRIEMPFERERELTPFEDIKLYIPRNAHTQLKYRYGETYMIPNPNWSILSYDSHIITWEDKRGVYFAK